MKPIFYWIRLIICSHSILAIISTSAQGFSTIGADGIIHGVHNINVKGMGYLLFGLERFSLGPWGHYSQFTPDISESIVGAGLRFDKDRLFLMMCGGYLQKIAFTQKYGGKAGIIVVGFKLNNLVQISLPLFFRYFDGTRGKKWTLDSYPLFGLSFYI